MSRSKSYVPVSNDNLSRSLDAVGLVPDELRGSDEFLDLVTWNIKYFHDRDPKRVEIISKILSELNADVIVLQEIMFDSLEPVISRLRELGAGHYDVAYGTTGGNQRVAIMWDLDWIRSKDDIYELVGKGDVRAEDGKDAFPRLPIWGYFTTISNTPGSIPFDFQLVGVHLKSQRGGGGPQRKAAGEWLSSWMQKSSELVDADIIIIGDWNEKPSAESWQAIQNMERNGEVEFSSINSESDISHLYYKNKRNIGSRLDLAAVSIAAYDEVVSDSNVVRWSSLDSFLEASPKAYEIKRYLKEISEDISDHLPVVVRFYFEDQSA